MIRANELERFLESRLFGTVTSVHFDTELLA